MQPQTHFCKFSVNRVSFENAVVAGTKTGFLSPRIAYIEQGECLCVSQEGTLPLKAGDVWILPAKQAYRSVWTPTPSVQFFYIEYEADFLSLSVKHFDKIENFPDGKLFKNLYSSKTDIEKISAFYKILEKTLLDILPNHDVDVTPILPALDYIKNNFETPVKVAKLARFCLMSESKFFTEFKRITGMSPIEYKNSLRIEKAAELIRRNVPLEEICDELHYASPAFLRRQTQKYFGMNPNELKKNKKLL